MLPRVNPPSIKFNQGEVNVASNQISQAPKVVFIGPQTQQPQFQTPVLPVDVPVRPVNGDPEYETPESISLKHFNEQQYLIQQQLLHRDRQRLAEQERQQQLEIEKQQQEELKRRRRRPGWPWNPRGTRRRNWPKSRRRRGRGNNPLVRSSWPDMRSRTLAQTRRRRLPRRAALASSQRFNSLR